MLRDVRPTLPGSFTYQRFTVARHEPVHSPHSFSIIRISESLTPSLGAAAYKSETRAGYHGCLARSFSPATSNGSITARIAFCKSAASAGVRACDALLLHASNSGPNTGCLQSRNESANAGLARRRAVSEKLAAAK